MCLSCKMLGELRLGLPTAHVEGPARCPQVSGQSNLSTSCTCNCFALSFRILRVLRRPGDHSTPHICGGGQTTLEYLQFLSIERIYRHTYELAVSEPALILADDALQHSDGNRPFPSTIKGRSLPNVHIPTRYEGVFIVRNEHQLRGGI